MDDKIMPSDNTSEYKFSDAEGGEGEQQQLEIPVSTDVDDQGNFGTVETNGVEEAKPGFSLMVYLREINRKKIVAPISLIVAIFVVYAAFNFYSSRKANESEQKKSMSQEEAAALTQQRQFAEVTAIAKPAAPMVSDMVSSEQMMQMEGVTQQKIDSVLQQVKSGRDNIVNANETISQTQRDIAAVGKQIGQLTTAMQQIVTDIDALKTVKKSKPKKKVFKLPVAYHVRAIVPGRVWLESAKGETVTLRVGDKLEGYGTVKVINHSQGLVVMSNGSLIQYGIDDF